jgi:hypothetical protein
MEVVAARCGHLMHVLGVDVREELRDSFPESMDRVALRNVHSQRPNPRDRWRARCLATRKYVHLTPGERYERACFHAALIPRALRVADFMLQGAMLDLAITAEDVRSVLLRSFRKFPSFPILGISSSSRHTSPHALHKILYLSSQGERCPLSEEIGGFYNGGSSCYRSHVVSYLYMVSHLLREARGAVQMIAILCM